MRSHRQDHAGFYETASQADVGEVAHHQRVFAVFLQLDRHAALHARVEAAVLAERLALLLHVHAAVGFSQQGFGVCAICRKQSIACAQRENVFSADFASGLLRQFAQLVDFFVGGINAQPRAQLLRIRLHPCGLHSHNRGSCVSMPARIAATRGCLRGGRSGR